MVRSQYVRFAGLLVLLFAVGQVVAQSQEQTDVADLVRTIQDLRVEISVLKNQVEALSKKEREVRVQTGRVLITQTLQNDTFGKPYEEGGVFGQEHNLPEILSGEKRNRGLMEGRVDFPEPFASVPKVLIALSTLDTHLDTHTRIRVTVDQVDTKGFNYRFHTWSDTKLYRAEASWIAVADILPE